MDSLKSKKILYIISSFRNEGPVNNLYGLITSLSEKGYEIHILTSKNCCFDERYEDFKNLKVKIHFYNFNVINIFFPNKILGHVSKNLTPHIIHSYCLKSLLLLFFLRTTAKKLHTIQVNPFEQYPIKYGRIKGFIMALLSAFGYRKMNYLISCARHIEEKFRYKPIPISTIHNCVDINYFFPAISAEKQNIRKKYNLQGERIFTVLSRLSPEKNIQFIIKNFPYRPDFNLLIIGSGPQENILKAKAKNNVIFFGHKQNAKDILQMSDFIISASKVEGMPLSVLEAMACGAVPILSNIEPHKELLLNFNKNLLFEMNKEAFLSAIKYALNGTVVDSRKYIQIHFSAINMAEQHAVLYETIANL